MCALHVATAARGRTPPTTGPQPRRAARAAAAALATAAAMVVAAAALVAEAALAVTAAALITRALAESRSISAASASASSSSSMGMSVGRGVEKKDIMSSSPYALYDTFLMRPAASSRACWSTLSGVKMSSSHATSRTLSLALDMGALSQSSAHTFCSVRPKPQVGRLGTLAGCDVAWTLLDSSTQVAGVIAEVGAVPVVAVVVLSTPPLWTVVVVIMMLTAFLASSALCRRAVSSDACCCSICSNASSESGAGGGAGVGVWVAVMEVMEVVEGGGEAESWDGEAGQMASRVSPVGWELLEGELSELEGRELELQAFFFCDRVRCCGGGLGEPGRLRWTSLKIVAVTAAKSAKFLGRGQGKRKLGDTDPCIQERRLRATWGWGVLACSRCVGVQYCMHEQEYKMCTSRLARSPDGGKG